MASKKKADAAAHADYVMPFPTAEQCAKAVQVVVESISSPDAGGHDSGCVLNSMWIVAGYATGAMLGSDPGPTPPQQVAVPASDEEKVALLEEVKAHAQASKSSKPQPSKAIPWMLILDMVYTLIKEWLNSEGYDPSPA